MPEPDFFARVFVGEVDPAHIADLTVDHRDLAVVSAVEVARREAQGAGDRDADSRAFHFLREPPRQGEGTPEAVVYQTDIQTLFRFVPQDRKHVSEEPALFHDIVFEKNALPRIREVGEQFSFHFSADGEIFRVGRVQDFRVRVSERGKVSDRAVLRAASCRRAAAGFSAQKETEQRADPGQKNEQNEF